MLAVSEECSWIKSYGRFDAAPMGFGIVIKQAGRAPTYLVAQQLEKRRPRVLIQCRFVERVNELEKTGVVRHLQSFDADLGQHHSL